MPHTPVLLNESIKYLDPKEGDIVIDATVGSGGHSQLICGLIGEKGFLIGIDRDANNISALKSQSSKFKCQIKFTEGNFRDIDEIAKNAGVEKVNGILFDLGLNSRQLEESGRGFTFQKDEPLLMTFRVVPEADDLTAQEILNKWNEKEIADILYEYGEERFSRRIARKIVDVRVRTPIKTTFELVDLIRQSVPGFYRNNRKTNCCTKTFQALRIAVNDELNVLKEGLAKGFELLAPRGRIVVISFHSLEDRIVKTFFRDKVKPAFASSFGEARPASAEGYGEARGKILTKKPIVPSEDEARDNPRSRSAKLRALEKI